MLKSLILPLFCTALVVGTVGCQPTSEVASSEAETVGAADLPGAGVSVVPVNGDTMEEQFTTEVVNIGLEELGYETDDIQQATLATSVSAIADGSLSYTTGFFSPNQDESFERAGGSEVLEQFEPLIPEGGRQGFLIDKKTASQQGVTNLEQLKDPELAKLFDSDNDGKANLAGCQTGWLCNEMIENQIKAHDLQDTVEQDQGSYAIMIADVIARYDQGQSVLFYGYEPHWLLSKLKSGEDTEWLEVSATDRPESSGTFAAEQTTIDGKNFGLPFFYQKIIANKTFVQENPAAKRWFEAVKIPLADLNAESLRIEEGENTPEEVRRHAEEWVEENRALFDDWLTEAREASAK